MEFDEAKKGWVCHHDPAIPTSNPNLCVGECRTRDLEGLTSAQIAERLAMAFMRDHASGSIERLQFSIELALIKVFEQDTARLKQELDLAKSQAETRRLQQLYEPKPESEMSREELIARLDVLIAESNRLIDILNAQPKKCPVIPGLPPLPESCQRCGQKFELSAFGDWQVLDSGWSHECGPAREGDQ